MKKVQWNFVSKNSRIFLAILDFNILPCRSIDKLETINIVNLICKIKRIIYAKFKNYSGKYLINRYANSSGIRHQS